MNLGQLRGIDKLRIMQLEDELGERAAAVLKETPPPKVDASPGPLEKRPMRKGIGKRIRSELPAEPPGARVYEIAARLRGVERDTVASFISMWPDVRRTGEPGAYRYYLPRSI
jgi:hypothetical protein